MTQIFGIHSINGLPDTYLANTLDASLPNIPPQVNNISSLYIASEPAGAQIFIDGIEQTGFRTPSMINDLPSGYHNIKLTSSGYIDIESSMPLDPGRTYNVFLTMERMAEPISTSSGFIILGLIALGLIFIKKK